MWWHLRNIGLPAQVAAAFAELAGRLGRDPLTQSSCWFDCQICGCGDHAVEQVAGPVHALDAPELRDLARCLTDFRRIAPYR